MEWGGLDVVLGVVPDVVRGEGLGGEPGENVDGGVTVM